MSTPRFASVLALSIAVHGCTDACPAEPLAPLTETPRWVVRVNARLDPPPPDPGIPGVPSVSDPPGLGTYASFSLHGADGAILSERWLDSTTRVEGVNARFDAATRLPSMLSTAGLTLLLAGANRPLVTLGVPGGGVAERTVGWTTPPEAGGQLLDVVPLGDGTAIANRREATDGAGGDLVLLDLDAGAPVRAYSLATLSTGAVRPTSLASVGGGFVAVGLQLADEPDAGAFAVVDAETGAAVRYDVPGLSRCGEVTALRTLEPQVAITCTGDATLAPSEHRRAGLALYAFEGETARFVDSRTATELFDEFPPTGPTVALAGDWVAVVSQGSLARGDDDALYAVHLTSAAGVALHEEPWTAEWGEALGRGDFAPDLGELWWPAATGGLLRWQMAGDDATATFTPLAAAPSQGCSRLPPREVRALPAGATPPTPDAGIDAGADAGTPIGPDASADAGGDGGLTP